MRDLCLRRGGGMVRVRRGVGYLLSVGGVLRGLGVRLGLRLLPLGLGGLAAVHGRIWGQLLGWGVKVPSPHWKPQPQLCFPLPSPRTCALCARGGRSGLPGSTLLCGKTSPSMSGKSEASCWPYTCDWTIQRFFFASPLDRGGFFFLGHTRLCLLRPKGPIQGIRLGVQASFCV